MIGEINAESRTNKKREKEDIKSGESILKFQHLITRSSRKIEQKKKNGDTKGYILNDDTEMKFLKR